MTISDSELSSREARETMNSLVTTLTITSAASAGVMAGIYFAFSTAVMGGLKQQPASSGISTMNAINDVIQNPLFLAVFTGSALSCTALAVTAKFSDQPQPGWRMAAAGLFVVGSFVVTAAINVPMNDKLAAVDPNSLHGAQVWQDYLSNWTAWNHVRTAASAVAAVGLTFLSRI